MYKPEKDPRAPRGDASKWHSWYFWALAALGSLALFAAPARAGERVDLDEAVERAVARVDPPEVLRQVTDYDGASTPELAALGGLWALDGWQTVRGRRQGLTELGPWGLPFGGRPSEREVWVTRGVLYAAQVVLAKVQARRGAGRQARRGVRVSIGVLGAVQVANATWKR